MARDKVEEVDFSINRICRILGLSKNTYYNSKNPAEVFEQKYEWLKEYVEEVIEANPAYGIKRIKQALFNDHEVFVGRDALGKLLKIWGLGLKRKTKKRRPSVIEQILQLISDRANLLVRTTITAPLQAVTSDITVLKYKGGVAYLCVHKDVFGQMVYGYSLALDQRKELVLQSFRMAMCQIKKICKRIPRNMLCHQDQGSQYTSYKYVETVKDFDLRLSFSTKGTPTDNAGQESFFGRFKDDYRDEIAEIETFEELEEFVNKKIFYYNERRLHTSIGNKSPKSFTIPLLKKLNNRFTTFRA